MPKATNASPPDMSIVDAAEYMNVSVNHVRAMIAAGDLPAYRLGRRRVIRLRRNEIDAALRPMQ
jgi:excisionase family DNA binding protein